MVALADMNNDAHLDVVAMQSYGGGIAVWLNRGDGTFYLIGTGSTSGLSKGFTIGDLNADGALDVAATGDTGYVTVLVNDGTGRLAQCAAFNGGGPLGPPINHGDFNGDDVEDICLVNSISNNGTVRIFSGNGNCSFVQTDMFWFGGRVGDALQVGDFNADNTQDIVLACTDERFFKMFANDGVGHFSLADSFEVPVGLLCMRQGSIDNDAFPDLVAVASNSRSFCTFQGTEDGHFRYDCDGKPWNGPTGLGLGEFTRDGRIDVAVADVTVLRILKGRLFNPFRELIPPLTLSVCSVAGGDVSGDQIDDLVVGTPYGRFGVMLGRSDYVAPSPELLGWSLSEGVANPGQRISARYSVALAGQDVFETGLDLRLWSQNGALEVAPFDTVLSVISGSHWYERFAKIPEELPGGWYSCNWVLNDGVTGAFLGSSGWVDSSLHVVEAPTGPLLAVSPHPFEFGPVALGEVGDGVLHLASVGDETVTVSAVEALDSAFSVGGGSLPWHLAPDSSMSIPVFFEPGSTAEYVSSLVFAHNEQAGMPDSVVVSGTGITGSEGAITIDEIHTWTTWMSEDWFPPFVAEPSRIELTVRNYGETPFSERLRAVVSIGDLYGQGEGDRFWTLVEDEDTEVQSESFSAADNPTLDIKSLMPGEVTTIVLSKLDHWPFLLPRDFVYKVPDFSELLVVYLISGDQIVAQQRLDLEDGFEVTVGPGTVLNCISEILTVFCIPFPVKSFLLTGPYGVEASNLVLGLYDALTADPPDAESASVDFLDLVYLAARYGYEVGEETTERLPIVGIFTGLMDEVERNGCGALVGSIGTDLHQLLVEVLEEITPEHADELGGLTTHLFVPGGHITLLIDIASEEGARVQAGPGVADAMVPLLSKEGEVIEPVMGYMENQFVAAFPMDNGYTVTLYGQSADSVDAWHTYIRPDSSMVKLRYEGLPFWDGSKAVLSLTPGAEDFLYEIDITNDGVADLTWAPADVIILDGHPPAPVTDFTVAVSDSTHTISWTNPSDLDLKGVRVSFGAPYCPTTAFSEPLAVDDTLGAPGEFRTFALEGMDPMRSYCYRAWSYDASGNYADPDSGAWASGIEETNASRRDGAPIGLRIHPNPLTKAATVSFDMAVPADVTLEVWDLQGRRIRNLLETRLGPGPQTVTWDGLDDARHTVATGLYWVTLRHHGQTQSRQLILIR